MPRRCGAELPLATLSAVGLFVSLETPIRKPPGRRSRPSRICNGGLITRPLPVRSDSARALYLRGEMESEPVSRSVIDAQIHVIRGVSVMLDSDLAGLYGVSVKALLQAVRRNRKRFPSDFLFPVPGQELTRLRSQF